MLDRVLVMGIAVKRVFTYILIALAAGALIFGWGYRRGVNSLEVRDSVHVMIKRLPPLTYTVRDPWPVAVHEPADTIWVERPADTAAIVADYMRARDYHFDFSTDTTGRFEVDATVHQNRIASITPTIQPIVREITQTRTITQTRRPRWEVGPSAGAWVAKDSEGIWVGATASRYFGWINVSASAGYDTSNNCAYGQLSATIPIWKNYKSTHK